ncbi:hypothetical protein HOLleu_27932 [Holothuria leucospilota]|uniref:Endonuclease/exonuclease/phosphatase domain-containing protein n=1 Tax=Holothuria leucospilota TaxID=206669 RepID=A0A9Q1BR38_HOLLE|nr:hypothetical protein HOLleu_27932 [Holothuria leucospilota]
MPTLHCKIINSVSHLCGRYFILDIELIDKCLTLACIYGSNNDEPYFFSEINRVLHDFRSNIIILGGDFNFVFNIEIDKIGFNPRTNFKGRNEIYSLMKDFDLKDIWRELNHNNFRYTWKSNSDPIIYCRLDYFLISFSLVNTVKSCEILAGLISDHNPITMSFESCFSGRGPGYWKLNVSLLKNADYVQAIKDVISHSLDKYEDLNPHLIWELLKCDIRGASIQYSVRESKKRNSAMQQPEDEIANLELQLSMNPSDASIKEDLAIKRTEFSTLLVIKTKGVIIRTRSRWCLDGERCTKYFVNLERKNYQERCIRKLHVDDLTISEPAEILEAEHKYFSILYGSNNVSSDLIERYFYNYVRYNYSTFI